MAEARDILMPKLGLTMTEGEIAEWRLGPGDAFAAGDVLFVVEPDKISNDVEAREAGVIVAIVAGEGETVEVGGVVATYTPAGGG